jgi:hypothetical protein
LRVVADALLEAARLADIEHVAGLVEHAVDAGAVRQLLDELGDQVSADKPGLVGPALVPVDGSRNRRGGAVALHLDIVVRLVVFVVKNATIRQLP